jgi:hypothetical protein
MCGKLSLYLFTEHNQNQEGLLPVNLLMAAKPNDIPINVRTIFLNQTTSINPQVKIKVIPVGTSKGLNFKLHFKEVVFSQPSIPNIKNLTFAKTNVPSENMNG